jgi:hypothetical protein
MRLSVRSQGAKGWEGLQADKGGGGLARATCRLGAVLGPHGSMKASVGLVQEGSA